MNKKNMQLVLDHIKTHPKQFDMSSFGETAWNNSHLCCTAACICGTANLISQQEELNETDTECDFYKILRDEETACDFLGLTLKEGDALFFVQRGIWKKYAEELDTEFYTLSDVKAHHAIAMLENLISGVWDFSGIVEEPVEDDEEDNDDYEDSEWDNDDDDEPELTGDEDTIVE